MIAFVIFTAMLLSSVFSLAIYTAVGLSILYLLRLASLLALEHTPKLRKHLKLVWYATFFIAIYIYNVFILGGVLP